MRITESKLRRIIRSVIKEASLPSTDPKELRDTFSYKRLPDPDKEYESDEQTLRKMYSDILYPQEQLKDEVDDYNDPIFDPLTQEEIDDHNFINSFLKGVVYGINKSCSRHLYRKARGNHPYASSIEKLKKLKSDCLSLGRDGTSILVTKEFPASEEVKTKLEKEIKNILVKRFPQHPDDIKSSRIRIHHEIYSEILKSLL